MNPRSVLMRNLLLGVSIMFVFCTSLCSQSVMRNDSADFFFKKGLTKDSVHKYSESIIFYSNAIERRANYVEAYVIRAQCKLVLKNEKDAVSDCSKAIEINPQ